MVAIAIAAIGDTDRYSLELVIPVERFAETLQGGMLPQGGVAVLVDGKGEVIARAPPSPSESAAKAAHRAGWRFEKRNGILVQWQA